jgi:selenocysteine-specific elongation factor
VFGLVLDSFVGGGVLEDRGITAAPPGWQAALSAAQQQAVDTYLALLLSTPYSPPLGQRPGDDLVTYLVDRGQAVDAGDNVVFAREAYEAAVAIVVEHLRSHGPVTLATVRDLLGTSRRYAQALLDHMDSQRITMRRGDERVLRTT